MKWYLPGIFYILLITSVSGFKSYDQYLTVDVPVLTASNVYLPDTYSSYTIACNGTSMNPCVIDLTLALDGAILRNKADFMNYLGTFPTAAIRIAEVNRMAISWKD